jgi:2',3'-cyclic-nucleotide 2'-phosphodiesterase (5'-nucleotidase family)
MNQHRKIRGRTRRSAAALAALAAAGVLAACAKQSPPERLAISYSNDLRGEIRSCGCASKDLGGLGRRATFLKALRDTTGDLLVVDAGDFFASSINYGVEKADLTMKSMALMGYDGAVPGEDDFCFGLEFLARRSREVKLPLIAANLYDTVADTLIFPPSRVVTLKSGRRVGLVGVMSPRVALPPQVPAGSLEIRDPLAAAQAAVDSLRASVDAVVVLAHMERGSAPRFAESLRGVDAVVHGHDGMPMRQQRRFGEAYLLQVAARGLYQGLAYLTFGPDGRAAAITDAVVPMDTRFEDDEAIAKLFRAYDLNIAAKEKETLPAGITDVRRLIQEPFQGADACRECHEDIHARWAQSRHAHAWQTLTDLSRELDQDCTPCHTVGFYKHGGFENIVETPHLTGVQCESCHGNGAAHVADPAVKTGVKADALCRDCHNQEQSPEFVFEEFWKRIDHGPDAAAAGGGNGR